MTSRFVLPILLWVGLNVSAPAQVNTSSISGAVTDGTGSVVPGAFVIAIQADTRQERQTATGANGEYVLPQLPPGRFEITAKAPGFQTTVVRDVVLAIAQREVVNITLSVGQVTEEVTVTAEAAQLKEAETASLGQLIERRVIQDLPLNGRNYLTLGSLSPGVIPQIPSSQGPASFISSTTQRADRSILVGGQRESSTSYLLDGVELRNARGRHGVEPLARHDRGVQDPAQFLQRGVREFAGDHQRGHARRNEPDSRQCV